MRRAALARTATLAPTKVEVEEAMQKAIFALIKVGELLSVCKYGGARGPGTKSSAKTKVSCGMPAPGSDLIGRRNHRIYSFSPTKRWSMTQKDAPHNRDSAGCTFVRTFFLTDLAPTVEKRPARVDKLTSYMRRLNFERPRDPSRE